MGAEKTKEKEKKDGPTLAGGLIHGQGLGDALARTIVALVLAALLLPLVCATAVVFKEWLSSANVNAGSVFQGHLHARWQHFWAGVLLYVILHLLLPTRWMKFLLDHDPVRRFFEWLAAKPALGGWSGLIRVVMYALPVYTLILLAGVLITDHYSRLEGLTKIVAFVVGLAYAFHMVWVVIDLRRRQPEMGFAPYLLSLIIVFLCNVQVAMALLSQFSQNIDWYAFNRELWRATRAGYGALVGRG